MLIQSYCYEDRNGKTGTCGPQDIGVVADWGIWRNVLRDDVPAFLDMPGAGGCRIFLLSVPDGGKIMFALPLEQFTENATIYAVYRALMETSPETLQQVIGDHAAFDLPLLKCDLEQPPIPARFDDLDGLQLIGNTAKAISTVARMNSTDWAESFFLAVNPKEYRSEYTTIISGETPEGEWSKLSAADQQGKRIPYRTAKPHSLVSGSNLIVLIVLALISLSLCGMLFYSRAKLNTAEMRVQKLQEEKEQLQFLLKSREDRIRILQELMKSAG